VNGYRQRTDLFRRAVLWLEAKGGESAVLRAFGDPEPLEEAWELSLPEFKEALRSRVRDALEAGKGAA
jgi:hypothetical protein